MIQLDQLLDEFNEKLKKLKKNYEYKLNGKNYSLDKSKNKYKTFIDKIIEIQDKITQPLNLKLKIPENIENSFQHTQLENNLKVNEDIADRKQTVQKLKESEENLKIFNIKLGQEIKERKIKLNKSEETWRSLVNNLPNIITIINLDGKIQFINHIVAGIDIKNVIGSSIFTFIQPEYHNLVRKTIKNVFKTEVPSCYEIRGIGPHGRISWYETQIAPIKNDGQVVAVSLISTDITQRRKAEQNLIESEKKYRTLFEKSPYAVLLLDFQGNIRDINYITEKMYGYTKEDLIGKNFANISVIPSKYLSLVSEKFKLLLKGERSKPIEFQVKKKDGNLVWIRAQGSIVKLTNEALIFALAQNITEHKKVKDALRESGEKLRLAFENAVDAIFWASKTGLIIECNKKAEILLEKKREEIIGQPQTSLHPPQKADYYANMFKRHIKQKRIVKDEAMVITKSGKIIPVQITASVTLIGGEPMIQGIFRDITPRKRMEEILKEHAKKMEILNAIIIAGNTAKDLLLLLEKILNSTLEFMNFELGGIYLIDENSRIAELICYKGLPPIFVESIKCLKIDESPFDTVLINGKLIFTNNYDKISPKISEMGGVLSLVSIPLYSKDRIIGAICIASKTRHFFSNEEKDTLQSIASEIGILIEKMQAEEAIKESEEKYRNLVKTSPNSIILLDLEGKIIDCNEVAEKHFGLQKNEIINKNIIGLFSKKTNQLTIKRAIKYHQILKNAPFEFEFINHFGKKIWLIFFISSIKIGNEKFIQVVMDDITARKKVENIIKREIRKLKELDQIKTVFISRASHELKTPLNSIYSAATLLSSLYNTIFDERANRLMRIILKGSERLEQLIIDLLDTSRIESGNIKLEKREENIGDIIKQCIDDTSYLIKDREQVINFDIERDFFINVDKVRIEQVILNLLTNAIKNTPPKGTISISLKDYKDFVDIKIKDTGVGFTTKEKMKIFKKFGKIERYGKGLNVNTEGSGLGLYISKEIVDLHNGKIWVESKGRNKGSTLIIRLPTL
ncbi:MAG: PAS domain S-box protein [Promethearchaeota archaeon]